MLRVETAGDDGSYFRCWQPLTTEGAGRNVTIVRGHALRVREALADESPSGAAVTLRAYGQKVAQGFQVAGSWAAGRVALRASKTAPAGAPADGLVVKLCADDGGAPGTVLASGTIAGQSWGSRPSGRSPR